MVGNNRLQDILDYRNLANTDPMKLMQLQNQTKMPIVNRAIGSQVGDGDQTQAPSSSLNSILKKRVMDKDGTETDLLTEITEAFVDRMPVPEKEEAPVNLQSLGMNALGFNPNTVTSKHGGLIGMAAGGKFEGKVPGQGHGMEDNVYMPIVERQAGNQVATLAVSPDEYVVDAHTMSALGNGNADEGARYMDSMVKNIRKKAFGTDKQPNEINGLAALRPMIERV
jgi:hypothetical protein